MDAKYVQGSPTAGDADLTTSRGAATHTHTSPAHGHGQNSHTHTFSGSTITPTIDIDELTLPDSNAASGHSHGSTTSNSTTATNQFSTVTLDATSNDPPYFEVIWIESDGTPTGIPVNAYAFFSSDTLPTGWARVQGNKFLKGAAAAGDAGGTGGASDAHTHTNAAHNHIQNSHTHAAKNSLSSGGGLQYTSAGGTTLAKSPHNHSVSLDAKTPTNNTATVTIQNADGQPVFKKLNVINNGNASADLPTNLIAVWTGTHAGIPAGWSRFTSLDGNFLKGANADGESNVTTGGSQTHTHTANSHNHTQNAHNHTATAGTASAKDSAANVVETSTADAGGHTHTWTVGNTTATNQSTTITVSANASEDAYPPYVRVIFVQFTGVAAATPLRTLLGVGI